MCPAGWFKQAGTIGEGAFYTTKCEKCEAGKSTDGLAGTDHPSGCKECVAGSYSTTSGSSTCSNCNSGQYTDVTGSNKCSICSKCTKGLQRYTAVTGEFLLCGGSYIDSRTGKTALRSSAGKCNSCPNGRIKPSDPDDTKEYDTQCSICSNGKTHSANRDACVLCPVPTVGATGNGLCGTTCVAANGNYPNADRTACLSIVIESIEIGQRRRSLNAINQYLPGGNKRNLVDGSTNPDSASNQLKIKVSEGLSVIDSDLFVLRLCQADDVKCETPLSATTGTAAIAGAGTLVVPSIGPTCPTVLSDYYVQVGYHKDDVITKKDGSTTNIYLGDIVVSRSNAADNFAITPNVPPTIPAAKVVLLPTTIYASTPFFACQVDQTAWSDSDSDDSNVRLSGVLFETAVKNTGASTSWEISSQRDGNSPTAGRDWEFSANYLLRCGATLTDGCGNTAVTIASGDLRTVESLGLQPKSGAAKLDVPVDIIGAGFVAGSTDYECKFSGDGRTLTVPGEALTSKLVRCNTVGQKFLGSSDSQSVILRGKILKYKGCFSGKDINRVSTLTRIGGVKVRASTCQYMCYVQSNLHNMYFLHGGACYCGKSNQNQLPSSPLDPLATDSCNTACPALPVDDNTYQNLGCYRDVASNRDLSEAMEATLTITPSQNIVAPAGTRVTQGTGASMVTGTLKTALDGDTTSIVVKTITGVTFVTTNEQVVIGTSTIVLATNIISATHAVVINVNTAALCSDACEGYAFFGVQNDAKCYCGNTYGKFGAATGDCPLDERNQMYQQTTARGSSGLQSSMNDDSINQQCGSVADTAVACSDTDLTCWKTSLSIGHVSVYGITPSPLEISAGYFRVSASAPGEISPPTVSDIPGGVSVSWLPPVFMGGSSDVDAFYYKILYQCIACDGKYVADNDEPDITDACGNGCKLVRTQGALSDVVLALQPLKQYKFRVVAKNAVDWGEISASGLASSAEAGQAVPPEPPAILSLSTVDSKSVTLSFPLSEYDGGVPITQYMVKYTMKGDGCGDDSGDVTVEPIRTDTEGNNVWAIFADKRTRREGIAVISIPPGDDETYTAAYNNPSCTVATGGTNDACIASTTNLATCTAASISNTCTVTSSGDNSQCASANADVAACNAATVSGGADNDANNCIFVDNSCNYLDSLLDASGNLQITIQEPYGEQKFTHSCAVTAGGTNSDCAAANTNDATCAGATTSGGGGVSANACVFVENIKNGEWNTATFEGLKPSQTYTFQLYAFNFNQMESFRIPSPALEVTTDAATTPRYICAPAIASNSQTIQFKGDDVGGLEYEDAFTNTGSFKLIRGGQTTACIPFNGDEQCDGDACAHNIDGADVKFALEGLSNLNGAEISVEVIGFLAHGDARVVINFEPDSFADELLEYSVEGCTGPKNGEFNVAHGTFSSLQVSNLVVTTQTPDSDGCEAVRALSLLTCPPDKDVWIEAGGVLEADGSQGVWESMVSDPDFDPNTICTVSITDPDCVATSVPTAYATPPCPNIAAAFNWALIKDDGTGEKAAGQIFKLRQGIHVLTKELYFPVRNMKLLGYGPVNTIVQCAANSRCLVADSAHAHPKDGITFAALIEGLTFQGGTTTSFGGAILIQGATRPIVFRNIVVKGNTAVAGGGIAVMSVTSRVDFSTGVFITNNQASHFGGGLLVVASQEVRLKNAELSSNSAQFGGGIATLSENRLLSYLPASVTASMRSANTDADTNGGGSSIEIRSSLTVDASVLEQNTAVSSADGTGGAVYAYESDVSFVNGATVSTNKASMSGGGCFFQASSVSIVASTLGSNQVVGTRGKGGGFSCISSTIKVRDSTFQSNMAQQDGGAISATFCPVILTDVQVQSNQAITGKGGGLNVELMCEITIKDSTFFKNQAQLFGGGIFAEEVLQLRVSSSLFNQNNAGTEDDNKDETRGGGGAIATVSSKNIKIINTAFLDCISNGAAGGGALRFDIGDIEIGNLIDRSIDKNTIGVGHKECSNCWTSTLEQSKYRPIVSNSNFTSNKATVGGGGALKWLASSRAMTNLISSRDDPILWSNNKANGNTALYGDMIASGPHIVFIVNGPVASLESCGKPFYYQPRLDPFCANENQCPTFETRQSDANKRLENGGKKFTVPLRAEILDFYGRTIKSSQSIVQIKKDINAETTFGGTVNIVAVQGIAIFEDLTVDEPPTDGDEIDEIQVLTIDESLVTQTIRMKNTFADMTISQIVVTGTSAVATFALKDIPAMVGITVSVGDVLSVTGATDSGLNKLWTITVVSSDGLTLTFDASENSFATDGTYSGGGNIEGFISVKLSTTETTRTFGDAYTLQYFDTKFCVPYDILSTELEKLLYGNVEQIKDMKDVTVTSYGDVNSNNFNFEVKITKTTEIVYIESVNTDRFGFVEMQIKSSNGVLANAGLLSKGDQIIILGVDATNGDPEWTLKLNDQHQIQTVSDDGMTLGFGVVQKYQAAMTISKIIVSGTGTSAAIATYVLTDSAATIAIGDVVTITEAIEEGINKIWNVTGIYSTTVNTVAITTFTFDPSENSFATDGTYLGGGNIVGSAFSNQPHIFDSTTSKARVTVYKVGTPVALKVVDTQCVPGNAATNNLNPLMEWTITINSATLNLVPGKIVTQTSQSGTGTIKTAVRNVATTTIVIEAPSDQIFDTVADFVIDVDQIFDVADTDLAIIDNVADTLVTISATDVTGISMARRIYVDGDIVGKNNVQGTQVSIDSTNLEGSFEIGFVFDPEINNLGDSNGGASCETRLPLSSTATITLNSETGVLPTALEFETAIRSMKSARQNLGSIKVTVENNIALVTHAETKQVFAKDGDIVTLSDFMGNFANFSSSWVVLGTPAPSRVSFAFDISTLYGTWTGALDTTGQAALHNSVAVTRTQHKQPSESVTYSITFVGAHVAGEVPQLTIVSALTGDIATAKMSIATTGSIRERITYPAAVSVPGTNNKENPPFGALLRDCVPGEYLQGGFECTACLPGRFSKDSNAIECTACALGRAQPYRGRDICYDCTAGAAQNGLGQSECLSCETGKWTKGSTGEKMCNDECPSGTHGKKVFTKLYPYCQKQNTEELVGGACTNCPTGWHDPTTGTYCLKEVAQEIGDCISCPTGWHSPVMGNIRCMECNTGYYANEEKTVHCPLCEAGKFSKIGSSSCELLCPTGSYKQAIKIDYHDPASTLTALVSNTSNTSSIEELEASEAAEAAALEKAKLAENVGEDFVTTEVQVVSFDTFAVDTDWSELVGDKSYIVTHNVLSNSVGFSPGDNVTVKGASEQSNLNTVFMVHRVLDRWRFIIGNRRGLYQVPESTHKYATSIPVGDDGKPFIIAGKGISAMTTCEDCPPGRSGAQVGFPLQTRPGLPECDQCDPGRFSNKGQKLCDECWPGTAAKEAGSRYMCDACEGGRYSPSTGYVECTACEPGLFNEEPCDENGLCQKYADCDMCGAGKATGGQSNATKCTPCASGRFGTDHFDKDRLLEVPPNPNARYAKCDPCPKNKYSNYTGVTVCENCPTKTFTRNKIGQSECETCWRGEIFGNNQGENECIACPGPNSDYPTGTYSFVPGDERPECHACPSGAKCDGLDLVQVKWGWWKSTGRTQAKDKHGSPGKCSLGGELPKQCGDECDRTGQVNDDKCIEMPTAGGNVTASVKVVRKLRCRQDWMSGKLGEMYDECGVRRHLLMCDGDEPGKKCSDFLSLATSAGYSFEGEAERLEKKAFDFSSGDFDKLDGSKIHLPDGCNACRLTTLVTNVQLLRVEGDVVSSVTKSFDLGYMDKSIHLDTNVSASNLKIALKYLGTDVTNVLKRGTTTPLIISCAKVQEQYEYYDSGTCYPGGLALSFDQVECVAKVDVLRTNCNELPECYFDENVAVLQTQAISAFVADEGATVNSPFPPEGTYADIRDHCKVRGSEWLITFNNGYFANNNQVPLLSVNVSNKPVNMALNDDNNQNISMQHNNVMESSFSQWSTGESISVQNATSRRVLCNGENGKDVTQANADESLTCHEFNIFQLGSKSGTIQTVRYQENWNHTVYSELSIANTDHRDEDAPAHRCNVAAGYSGRMCQVCLPGFGRSGRFGCKRCSSDPVTTGMVSLMGLGAAIAYISLFVYVVIKDAGSTSTAGSVQKILLNHFQLVSICVNYPLNWPSNLLSMFNYFSFLSDISEKVLDLDCALKDQTIFGWTGLKPFFLLQLFYAVIPILMILGFICFWLIKGGVLHCCCGGDKKSIMDTTRIVLTEVPEGLKEKYQERLRHEKLLAKQHMFKYAARMTAIKNAPVQGFKGLTDAVQATYHKHERAEAKHHIQGLTRILKSTFKKTSDLSKEDKEAVGRMRAREFVNHCRDNHIHLREIWMQYDHNHTGHIPYSAFEHIVRSLGFEWTDDEMALVCEIFDHDNMDDDKSVALHNLVNFGKTTKDKIIVTTLVILYILYPTVARQVFKLLACRGGFSDGPTSNYLLYDLSLSCWTGTHLYFLLAIGLPTVILYVLGFPGFTYYILNKTKHKFGDDEIMFRYGVLHAGYRHKVFYWEAMISLRKATMIGVSVFTLTWGVQVQAFIGLFFVIGFMAITIRARPYEKDHLNSLENWSLGMSFITLYCGLVFYDGGLEEEYQKGLAWFLIAMNATYVAWVLNTLIGQYIKRYGCRKVKQTKEMQKILQEAQEQYAKEGNCAHLERKKKGLSSTDRMKLGLGKFSGMGSSSKTSSLKLKQRDDFISRLSFKKSTGLSAKFRARAKEAVHMDRAYKNIKNGQETLSANHRKQQLRRKGSKSRLNNRLKRRRKLAMAKMAQVEIKMHRRASRAQAHVSQMNSHMAMVHPSQGGDGGGGQAPEANSFEAFQLKKQQDEFQAFLDAKRMKEMQEFQKHHKSPPVHTATERKIEMQQFVSEHKHDTAQEIQKDLVDFVAEGHSKDEVKEIINRRGTIKLALTEEVPDLFNHLDEFLEDVENAAEDQLEMKEKEYKEMIMTNSKETAAVGIAPKKKEGKKKVVAPVKVKGGREKIAPYRGTMVNEEGKVVIKEVSSATVGVSGRGDDERLGNKSMGGVANAGVPTEIFIIWGLTKGESDPSKEKQLHSKSGSLKEANKNMKMLANKHGCHSMRVGGLPTTEMVDSSSEDEDTGMEL